MKRKLIKLVITLLCVFAMVLSVGFSACLLGDFIGRDQTTQPEIVDTNEEKKGDDFSIGILLADDLCKIRTGSMEQYNKWNKMTSYFAPNIVAQVTQEVLDESVLQMVEYMRSNGRYLCGQDPVTCKDETTPDGRDANTGDFIAIYAKKRVRFIYYRCKRDENDNNNKGFWSLYIIDVKDIVDEEAYLNYAHQYAPGIHVGYPLVG